MKLSLIRILLLAMGASSLALLAQSPPGRAVTLGLSGEDTRAATIPAGSTSTRLSFTVNQGTAGSDFFVVITSDPSVVVSLLLPSGREITKANAAAQGFTFSLIPPEEIGKKSEIPTIFSLPGAHTIIELPAGQVPGTYLIKADAPVAKTESGIIAMYSSSSAVQTTAQTNAGHYAVGEKVVLSGLVFDGDKPVTGATVVATVTSSVSLSGPAALGKYKLVSRKILRGGMTEETYSVHLLNRGPASKGVVAELSGIPWNVEVVTKTLAFGDVAAKSSSTPSVNHLVVQVPPNQPFDPTSLFWDIKGSGPSSTVTLVDSGPYDAATGDGIYTGIFEPSVPGLYRAVLSLSGTSSIGDPFSRTASAGFEVTQDRLATIRSLVDSPTPKGISVSVNIDVRTAGAYYLNLSLKASNNKVIQGGAQATLPVGPQQMTIVFPRSEVFRDLGAGGPYEFTDATLTFKTTPESLLADSKPDAGPTAHAYDLATFALPVYFSGPNSAAGVMIRSTATFDALRVNMGVIAAANDSCFLQANLEDMAGKRIDFAYKNVNIAAGQPSVSIDFDGNKLSMAADGPYVVGHTSLQCRKHETSANTLFQTQKFTASQFTHIRPDFSLSVWHNPPVAALGHTVSFGITSDMVGILDTLVDMTVSGLPPRTTASFDRPSIEAKGPTNLHVKVGLDTPLGTYPLTITGTSGALVHTTAASLVVVPAMSVTIKSLGKNTATLIAGPGQRQQLRATANGDRNEAVTWSLSSGSPGSIDARTGFYQLPADVESEQIVTITATSVVDPTKSASIQLAIQPRPAPAIQNQ